MERGQPQSLNEDSLTVVSNPGSVPFIAPVNPTAVGAGQSAVAALQAGRLLDSIADRSRQAEAQKAKNFTAALKQQGKNLATITTGQSISQDVAQDTGLQSSSAVIEGFAEQRSLTDQAALVRELKQFRAQNPGASSQDVQKFSDQKIQSLRASYKQLGAGGLEVFNNSIVKTAADTTNDLMLDAFENDQKIIKESTATYAASNFATALVNNTREWKNLDLDSKAQAAQRLSQIMQANYDTLEVKQNQLGASTNGAAEGFAAAILEDPAQAQGIVELIDNIKIKDRNGVMLSLSELDPKLKEKVENAKRTAIAANHENARFQVWEEETRKKTNTDAGRAFLLNSINLGQMTKPQAERWIVENSGQIDVGAMTSYVNDLFSGSNDMLQSSLKLVEDLGKAGYGVPKSALEGMNPSQQDWLLARNKVALEERKRTQNRDVIQTNQEVRAQQGEVRAADSFNYSREGRSFLTEPVMNMLTQRVQSRITGVVGVGMTTQKGKEFVTAYNQVLMASSQGSYKNPQAFYANYQNNLKVFKNNVDIYTSSPQAAEKLRKIIDSEIAAVSQQASAFSTPRQGNNPSAPVSTSKVASSNVLKSAQPKTQPKATAKPANKAAQPSVKPKQASAAQSSQRRQQLAKQKW